MFLRTIPSVLPNQTTRPRSNSTGETAGTVQPAALLGIIVIQAISSGLTLLDLSSSLRYMITGAVLAIAVIVDSLSRRSRMSSGRA